MEEKDGLGRETVGLARLELVEGKARHMLSLSPLRNRSWSESSPYSCPFPGLDLETESKQKKSFFVDGMNGWAEWWNHIIVIWLVLLHFHTLQYSLIPSPTLKFSSNSNKRSKIAIATIDQWIVIWVGGWE